MTKSINYQGASIAYSVNGSGPWVMLLHGFAEKADVWHTQQAALEKDFKLIIPSLPGTGASELASDMSIEGMARVLAAIAEAEQINRLVMIGHSMGGYITLAFAALFPEKLMGWGLFHSTAYPDTDEKMATRRKGIEFIRENGAAAFIKSTTPNLFAEKTRTERKELIDDQVARNEDFDPEALIAYYQAMIERPDRTKTLKESNLPVFFAFGKEDNAIPYADSLAQSHLPSLSYITIFNHSGHMGMLEEPEKASNALRDYLNQVYLGQS